MCSRRWSSAEPQLLRDVDATVVAGLYRYVDGRPANVRGARERERLARVLAAFVSRLHAVDVARLAGCDVRRYEPWRDEFAPMVRRVLPHLAPRTASWLQGRAERLADFSDRLPAPVLIHADLKPTHVILDSTGEIVGVLDFESIPVTDPAFAVLSHLAELRTGTEEWPSECSTTTSVPLTRG